MDERDAMVWIDSPEEFEQMPDDVRKVLEEMDSAKERKRGELIVFLGRGGKRNERVGKDGI